MEDKKKFTETERQALAEKLDADLDAFIDSMAANNVSIILIIIIFKTDKPKKSFDIDEWCENLGKHPAFMTNLEPDENGEYSEAIQAMQALKYDDDDETDAYELAKDNKDEGNKHFQAKKFRWAIDCYTNGIKRCCTDRLLNSVLYANRAAAHKHLGNKTSALKDCLFAKKFDPTNLKAITRGGELLLELRKYNQCIKWIDDSKNSLTHLDNEKRQQFDTDIASIREKANMLRAKEERDERKQNKQEAKELSQKSQLIKLFRERSLKFSPPLTGYLGRDEFDELFEWSELEVNLPECKQTWRVYYDEELKQLVWPLLVQYPEKGQTDFLTECMERTSFHDCLEEVLSSPAPWDPEHQFKY